MTTVNIKEAITKAMKQHVESVLWARYFRGLGNKSNAAYHLSNAAYWRKEVMWWKNTAWCE